MKKSAVSEYGYINAKLRSRISTMLTEEFKNALINSENIEAAVHVLSSNGFIEAAESWNLSADIQNIEFELFKVHIKNYRMLMKNTDGELHDFINILSMKPEIENIKSVIRLWYGNKIKNRPIGYRAAYIYKERLYEDIQWEELINSVNWENIKDVFKNTIYKSVFNSHSVIDSNDGLFLIETALDRLYYRYIIESSASLKTSDSDILNEIISTEIDLQNISWLIRYRHFYKMEFSELSKILIPGGNGLKLEGLQTGKINMDAGFSPVDLLKKSYPELAALSISNKHKFSGQAQLFEQLLDETRKRIFTKIITGYPFTIGIILVYFFISECELHFIASVLNGKNYGLSSDRIKEFIR